MLTPAKPHEQSRALEFCLRIAFLHLSLVPGPYLVAGGYLKCLQCESGKGLPKALPAVGSSQPAALPQPCLLPEDAEGPSALHLMGWTRFCLREIPAMLIFSLEISIF